MSDYIFALSDLECSPIQSELQDLFPLRLFEFVADINKQKEGRALVVTDLIDSFNLECINSDLAATYEVIESGSISVSVYMSWGTIHGVSADGIVSLEDVSFVLHGEKEDVTFHKRNAIGWILLSLFAARINYWELTVIGNYDFSERLELAELQSRFFGQKATSQWCDGMDISYIALEEGRKKWGLEFFSYDNCHFGFAVSQLSWGNYVWFNGT